MTSVTFLSLIQSLVSSNTAVAKYTMQHRYGLREHSFYLTQQQPVHYMHRLKYSFMLVVFITGSPNRFLGWSAGI